MLCFVCKHLSDIQMPPPHHHLFLQFFSPHVFIYGTPQTSTTAAPMAATTTTTSKPFKKLGQFLEEHQEPFILEIYLLERGGCPRKNLNSDKSLKRSGSSTRSNTSKNGSIPQCPKLFKVVYNKLVSINAILKIKNIDKSNSCSESSDTEEEATASQSCSESGDAEEEAPTSLQKDDISMASETPQSFRVCNPEQKEAAADRDQWRNIEESKQIRPVSILEGIPYNNGSPLQNSRHREENPSKSCIILTKKRSEDSILSASLWNLFFHSATEKQCIAGAAESQDIIRHKPTSEFLKSKRESQQTKQLLFDCMRELVETQESKQKSQQNRRENLESELLGKLICEKIKTWKRQSRGRLSITKLLDSDCQDSAEEWTNFEPQIRDNAMEIGDAILEEIRDQIVTDMVYFS